MVHELAIICLMRMQQVIIEGYMYYGEVLIGCRGGGAT